jgi:hypothetical protein
MPGATSDLVVDDVARQVQHRQSQRPLLHQIEDIHDAPGAPVAVGQRVAGLELGLFDELRDLDEQVDRERPLPDLSKAMVSAGRWQHEGIDLAHPALVVDELEVRPDVPGVTIRQVLAQPVQRLALPGEIGFRDELLDGR